MPDKNAARTHVSLHNLGERQYMGGTIGQRWCNIVPICSLGTIIVYRGVWSARENYLESTKTAHCVSCVFSKVEHFINVRPTTEKEHNYVYFWFSWSLLFIRIVFEPLFSTL